MLRFAAIKTVFVAAAMQIESLLDLAASLYQFFQLAFLLM